MVTTPVPPMPVTMMPKVLSIAGSAGSGSERARPPADRRRVPRLSLRALAP